ncbi:MAG TPA: hypothetical protein PLW81_04495 [Thiobacillaceae bacterium]|nr:hypothetical protein [Thiobacillaceae bacterium]
MTVAWFQKEMDYARDSLSTMSEKAIDRAGERLSEAMREGVKAAGAELREVVQGTSTEIDAKLDKISLELHEQRQFTKDDVRELVDYAAERLSSVLDERIAVMRREITDLVKEKTEYFKAEIDDFFIKRQQDLARERRRMVINIALAFAASVAVGVVSFFYKGLAEGQVDMMTVFRIVLASLGGGYGVWLAVSLIRHWLKMEEHRKDALFLAARYWGWLRPTSVFSNLVLLLLVLALSLALIFPAEAVRLLGMEHLVEGIRRGW